ncbi:hypothetical protein MHK_002208 [Candidatus Magnetomorum sp. HK-1]|nr:hypothetical protein MHK_002208 [Candidatus Magnetomorum sp. HK-1]
MAIVRNQRFIDRVTSESAVSDDKPFSQAEKKRWFKFIVKLDEVDGENELYNSEAHPKKFPPLDVEKKYRLTLAAESVEKKEDKQCLSFKESCNKFNASLTSDTIIGIMVLDPEQRIRIKNKNEFKIEFDIETEANLFGEKPEFIIRFSDNEDLGEIRLPVMIDESEFTEKECRSYNALRLCLTPLSPEIIDQIVIMHVEPNSGTDQIRLLFFNPGHSHKQSPYFDPQTLDPLEFVDEKGKYVMPPEFIMNKISDASNSYERLELKDWIVKRRRQVGDDLILVVVDHSFLNIWWEMWDFGGGEYLGTYATIIRWLPVPVFAGSDYSLAFEKKKCTGKVFIHVDEDEKTMADEVAIFTPYSKATSVQCYDNIRNFLESNSHELGLVYIGGEGYYKKDKEDRTYHSIAIGKKNSEHDRLFALNLVRLDIKYNLHPFFFLNACASACLAKEKNQYFGFPFLLRYFQNGFIGTIGRVENKHAISVAKQLFNDFHNDDEGMLPARALRDLRSRVAEELRENQCDREIQLKFIFTFMYVYYGNPLARLRLIPAEKSENVNGTC